MHWKDKLLNQFISELKNDNKWSTTVQKILSNSVIGIHLAVFNEPFLSLILKGEKKMESRFSLHNISPFMKVSKGDVIILKESGGPIKGVFIAGAVKYYQNINKIVLKEIENKYSNLICSNYDKDFWETRNKAKYISLIEVQKVKKLNPFKSEKKDRTGWSVLRESLSYTLFNESI